MSEASSTINYCQRFLNVSVNEKLEKAEILEDVDFKISRWRSPITKIISVSTSSGQNVPPAANTYY